jgi:hypothetical protein
MTADRYFRIVDSKARSAEGNMPVLFNNVFGAIHNFHKGLPEA